MDRAFIAADAGEVVDPEGLANQLDGGMLQALSRALFERLRWEETHISSVDWERYLIMRFSRAPAIEVELIDRPGLPFLGA